jgi:hypothetical protein
MFRNIFCAGPSLIEEQDPEQQASLTRERPHRVRPLMRVFPGSVPTDGAFHTACSPATASINEVILAQELLLGVLHLAYVEQPLAARIGVTQSEQPASVRQAFSRSNRASDLVERI